MIFLQKMLFNIKCCFRNGSMTVLIQCYLRDCHYSLILIPTMEVQSKVKVVGCSSLLYIQIHIERNKN